jgi:hypothetical protein
MNRYSSIESIANAFQSSYTQLSQTHHRRRR